MNDTPHSPLRPLTGSQGPLNSPGKATIFRTCLFVPEGGPFENHGFAEITDGENTGSLRLPVMCPRNHNIHDPSLSL